MFKRRKYRRRYRRRRRILYYAAQVPGGYQPFATRLATARANSLSQSIKSARKVLRTASALAGGYKAVKPYLSDLTYSLGRRLIPGVKYHRTPHNKWV